MEASFVAVVNNCVIKESEDISMFGVRTFVEMHEK